MTNNASSLNEKGQNNNAQGFEMKSLIALLLLISSVSSFAKSDHRYLICTLNVFSYVAIDLKGPKGTEDERSLVLENQVEVKVNLKKPYRNNSLAVLTVEHQGEKKTERILPRKLKHSKSYFINVTNKETDEREDLFVDCYRSNWDRPV